MPDQTPEDLFRLLLSELSASGALPINAKTETDPDAPNVTLRDAVRQVFWKNTALFSLKDRPRSPGEKDDLFGHVLSLRAEQLQTQALLAALCEAAGVDVVNVFAQVKDYLNG